jgi:hypothetical protein
MTYSLSEAAQKLKMEIVAHILQASGYYNQQLNKIKKQR